MNAKDRARAEEAIERCRVALMLDDYEEARRALAEAESVPHAVSPKVLAYFRGLLDGER